MSCYALFKWWLLLSQHPGCLCTLTSLKTKYNLGALAGDLDFLRQYVGKNKAPMCGNTICQDRRFMARWMPTLEAYFHYRNLDVSSFKEVAKRWKPAVVESFKKQQAHTALADIRESIEELKHYREHFIRL